jgi:signal transduction histidine kinase
MAPPDEAAVIGAAWRWRTWLTNSIWTDEAGLGRQFDLLMALNIGIVTCLTITFGLLQPLGLADATSSQVALAFPVLFLTFSLLCLALARSGRLQLAVRLYVWGNFAATTLAVWLFEGTLSPGWLLYIWTITVAGSLLSPGHALGMTTAVLGCFVALAGLTQAGHYQPHFTFSPAGHAFLEVSVRMIMLVSTVGFLTFLNTRGLRQALSALEQEVAERRRVEASLRQSQERMRQAQKMDALGRLAGGVAHDFNNLLVGILSGSDEIIERLPADHPVQPVAAELKATGQRAAALVRQLLTFSRKSDHRPVPTDLGACVLGLAQLLRRVLGAQVTLEVSAAPGSLPVLIDPTNLEQVVMNLSINARDSMPEGGRLRIETYAVELEGRSGEPAGVPPGRWSCLAVQDTGTGMTAEVRERIFEPFFTTKAAGQGTGLGLATVFGIVEQARGMILVESEVGQGTLFRIYLPAASAPVP